MINRAEREPMLDVISSPEAEIIGHECGIYGQITSKSEQDFFNVASATLAIQNRGDQAFGGFVLDKETGEFVGHKAPGSINDVLDELSPTVAQRLAAVSGKVGISHVRWSTMVGLDNEQQSEAAQPTIIKDFAGAHNGNVGNAIEMAFKRGISLVDCATDSIALHKAIEHDARMAGMVPALIGLRDEAKGAYSLVMSLEGMLFGMRDPHGIRPLSIGIKPDGSYILASESVVFDSEDAEFLRDVEPGEVVEIQEGPDGLELISYPMQEEREMAECALDIGYFRRPDSLFRGRPAHVWRRELGEQMAREVEIDNPEDYLVIGIPESGLPAAEAFAFASGIQYAKPLTKVVNKRSFTAATKKEQHTIAAKKLEIDAEALTEALWDEERQDFKQLIIMDDSLVSGNQITRLTERLSKLGISREKIDIIIPFPELVDSCHLGSAIPESRLLSLKGDYTEQCDRIGVNSLQYLSLAGFRNVIPETCGGCFGDMYPVQRLEAVGVGIGSLASLDYNNQS